ncbi:MAG: RNA polymerase sigma factor [Gaiellaceae bacterium]|jgi:RNA polymerase sigma-70 factor, ECF subfamily
MDEARLVALARRGEQAAIEELFEHVWPLAWHWAYGVTGDRMLADHVAQESVHRAFRSLDRFDPARPFRPWLKRITVNLAIDELRRERRHDARRWMAELRPEPPVENGGLLELVVDAVRELPERQRTVVVLHYWLDTSVEEIADLLALPVGTVVSRLSRARAALRDHLEQTHA